MIYKIKSKLRDFYLNLSLRARGAWQPRSCISELWIATLRSQRRPKLVSGFTLIETMVAISILLIAVVGPMSIIGGSLSQITTARNQVIAINLAQEGIEAVRQRRDSNMLDQWTPPTSNSPTYWRNGLANNMEYVVSAPSLSLACGATCPAVRKEVYQTSTGSYYQSLTGMISGDTKTLFSRKVLIVHFLGNREILVTSTVTWTAQGSLKTIVVEESLFGISS